MIIPTVVQKKGQTERYFDIYSMLLQDRIVFINGEINHETAGVVVAQLIYLDHLDHKKDISLYINSPGGSIVDGMAIHDTMNFIKSDVSTICVGMAASMGAFLLSSGKKGKRYALPNSEIMIHQPLISGGLSGQATDIEIHTNRLIEMKKKLTQMMADYTGQKFNILKDAMERDNYMDPKEALKFGLIDKIIE